MDNSFGGPFHLFELEICKTLISRGAFSAEWFNSEEGKIKIEQSFHEALPFDLAVSELELWCKGWVSRNRSEISSPTRLAQSITCAQS